MKSLASCIYQWGWSSQDRFLIDCLGPVAREILDHRWARDFWFTRFDMRGPHIFVVFTAPDDSAFLIEFLREKIAAHLASSPCPETLSSDVLVARHAACRGRSMTALDEVAGFASNNTFDCLHQTERGYPHDATIGLPREKELWNLVSKLSLWAIDRLAARPVIAAILWTAALDRALEATGHSPTQHWQHETALLLPNVSESLQRDEMATLETLANSIRPRNRKSFERLFNQIDQGWGPDLSIETFVELATSGDDEPLGALRELNHALLLQLGQPVLHHIPLTLYAWLRRRAPELVVTES